jgi:hypothetical protein
VRRHGQRVHDFLVRAHRPSHAETTLMIKIVDLRDGAARYRRSLRG